MQPTTTFNHNENVSFFSCSFFPFENGFNLLKYRYITAKIEPNCITTKNISKNDFVTFNFMNSSSKIMCPVLLIGNHSVIPCTMPIITDFIISIKFINISPFYSLIAVARSGKLYFPEPRSK